MSKYKTGDKFVIEIGAERLGDSILYRIKGFNTLVFDDNGLDRLDRVNGGPTLRDAYDEGYEKGLREARGRARKGGISMICEVREYDNEVVLKNATLGDVIAVIQIWLHKDKELCFSNPASMKGEHEDTLPVQYVEG